MTPGNLKQHSGVTLKRWLHFKCIALAEKRHRGVINDTGESAWFYVKTSSCLQRESHKIYIYCNNITTHNLASSLKAPGSGSKWGNVRQILDSDPQLIHIYSWFAMLFWTQSEKVLQMFKLQYKTSHLYTWHIYQDHLSSEQSPESHACCRHRGTWLNLGKEFRSRT